MYIPEFWCGVILTVLSELILIFVISMFATVRAERRKEEMDESKEIILPSNVKKADKKTIDCLIDLGILILDENGCIHVNEELEV